MNSIHLLCLKFMPSLLPLHDSIRKELMANITPIHWYRFSCSPNIIIAPNRVNTGCEAFIGEAIVMGRCFMAKYASIHDVNTITAFSITYRCCSNGTCGT